MKLGNIRWIYTDYDGQELPQTATTGVPALVLELDGKEWIITTEQKALAHGMPAVFVDADFPDSVEYGPVPEDGVPEAVTFNGYTEDPAVVQLTRDFLNACRAGTFGAQLIIDPRIVYL